MSKHKTKRLPTWLNSPERKRLLSPEEFSPRNLARNWAILCTFIYGGLRCNELRMLDVEDLDFEARTIFVRFGKRAKQRIVPMHTETAAALLKHLDGRLSATRRDASASGPVFLSERKLRISLRRLRSLVKELGQQTDLRKDIHPHALRHSFAVALLDKGVDLETIRDLLGHDDIETTSIYLHCSAEKRRAAVDLI